MHFEQMIPLLKKGSFVKREAKDAKISILKTSRRPLIKVWTKGHITMTYKFTAEDILASDWEICE